MDTEAVKGGERREDLKQSLAHHLGDRYILGYVYAYISSLWNRWFSTLACLLGLSDRRKGLRPFTTKARANRRMKDWGGGGQGRLRSIAYKGQALGALGLLHWLSNVILRFSSQKNSGWGRQSQLWEQTQWTKGFLQSLGVQRFPDVRFLRVEPGGTGAPAPQTPADPNQMLKCFLPRWKRNSVFSLEPTYSTSEYLLFPCLAVPERQNLKYREEWCTA